MFAEVLLRYPPQVRGCTWTTVSGEEAFSGATVWRGESGGLPRYALKALVPGLSPDRLATIHRRMTRATESGLDFVPRVVPDRLGNTLSIVDGRCWEVTEWRPGLALLRTSPSPELVLAAVRELASLHRCWSDERVIVATAPAVTKRIELLTTELPAWHHSSSLNPSLLSAVISAEERVRQHRSSALQSLNIWVARSTTILPCLADPHPAHFLFTGNEITGVIDFGAMKIDTPAVDLARLLVGLPNQMGTSPELFAEARRRSDELFDRVINEYGNSLDVGLLRLLVDTLPICALANWCRRIATEPSVKLKSNITSERVAKRILEWVEIVDRTSGKLQL